ncbi:hypothetical protein, partial [Hoylesella timonensis]|uniref:hypothetical protein n=1 Tax=Hoylesella timonensis TaxID=386414 RepID=UPI0018CEC335
YPGRCPGLYSYWAFSPSLLAASTVVRCHGYTPYWAFSPSLLSASTGVRYHSYTSVGLSARLCSQHQQAYVTTVIRLLGFQPVFAHSINCCTVSWLYALLGFQPVFARNINW